jgi:AraC-like DNA-binding protein
MTHPLMLWNVALAGFGAALGMFFGAALLLKRSEQIANDFLAAFCFVFSLLMIGDVVIAANGVQGNLWTNNALDWAFLLLAPLFYFYVATLVKGARPSSRALLAGFLPAAGSLLWFIVRLALKREPAMQAAATDSEFMPTAYTTAFVVVAVAQLLAYCTAAYWLVSKHARGVENYYSSVQRVNLRWVQTLIWCALIAALAWIAGIFVQHPVFAAASAALPALMILFLGVLAQQQPAVQPTVATVNAPIQQTEDQPPAAAAKYAKSALTEDRMQAVADQLAQFMAQDKPFLEGDLTLGQLSTRTGVPQHQLSQVFSQHLRCSFFEYINRLRVEEAKRCLADTAYHGQTVLEIGLAAGFNSKAAFNAAFKRFTGTTPAAYRTQVS